MKSKTMQPRELPTVEQLTAELGREKYKRRYKRVLRSTIYTLIVVAAVAVLVATIWMPVLQIYGASMAPTLDEGDIVISVKGSDFAPGDMVAFYMGNKILVKRCIAGPGQWVDIDADGNVYVDGELLDEPYLTEKALGDCDISHGFPVPFPHPPQRSTPAPPPERRPFSSSVISFCIAISFSYWRYSSISRTAYRSCGKTNAAP